MPLTAPELIPEFIDPAWHTPEYEAALASVRALGDMGAAVAREALGGYWQDSVERRYGVLTPHLHLGWLRDGQEGRISSSLWCDHPECRQTPDGRRFYLAYPYDLHHRDLLDLVHVCEQQRLHCDIHGWSHYYPGATVMIVVQTEEQYRASL